MNATLTRLEIGIWYFQDSKKIDGKPSWIRGDVDDCTITAEERAAGIIEK